MEKLTVIYNDNSSLLVSNKRNGVMLPYFHNKVGYRQSIKSAVIQRYPKKNHEPLVLIKEGVAVVHDRKTQEEYNG